MGAALAARKSQPTILCRDCSKCCQPIPAARRGCRLRRDDDNDISGASRLPLRYQAGSDDEGRIEGVDILMGMPVGQMLPDLARACCAPAPVMPTIANFLPQCHMSGAIRASTEQCRTQRSGLWRAARQIIIEAVLEPMSRDHWPSAR